MNSSAKWLIATTAATSLLLLNAGTAVAADVNTAPSTTISGESTGLLSPYGVSLDSSCNVYVTNGWEQDGKIMVFPSGADGNIAPTRVISGTNTLLVDEYVLGIATDEDDYLYVTDDNSRVLVFAPGASGNVAPVRVIEGGNTGLGMATFIDIGPDGKIYVTDNANAKVSVFAADADGDVAPLVTISSLGDNTGVGVAEDGKILAASWASFVKSFDASGSLLTTLSGGTTTISNPYGIAVDGSTFYVADNDAILSFEISDDGDVAPIERITGAATGIAGPRQITIGTDGRLWAANSDNGSASVTAYGEASGCPAENLAETGFADAEGVLTVGAVFAAAGMALVVARRRRIGSN